MRPAPRSVRWRPIGTGEAVGSAATEVEALPALVGHQRQQEAGCDDEAQHRDDDRQDLLRRGKTAAGMVMRRAGQRLEMHAEHRGVMHAGDGDAESNRADDQPNAFLLRQEGAQAAIGRDDGDHDRQQHHDRVVHDTERAGQPVDADIMHAGDADAEQHRRRRHALQGSARRSRQRKARCRPPARRSGTR